MIEVSGAEDSGDELQILPARAQFEGVLAFSGRVRMAGALRGSVVADGRLVIEPGAIVHGEIEIDELIVAGRVEGTIAARRRLEIRSGAHVSGEVRTPCLQLDDGAVVDGRCSVGALASAD